VTDDALRQKAQTPQDGDAQEEKKAEKRQAQKENEPEDRRIIAL
jgi:hypothetical protein